MLCKLMFDVDIKQWNSLISYIFTYQKFNDNNSGFIIQVGLDIFIARTEMIVECL